MILLFGEIVKGEDEKSPRDEPLGIV